MAMVAKPIIPQTRIGFTGAQTPRIPPSIGSTVAIPLSHDWGPMGSELSDIEVLDSFEAWTDKYGDSDTEGRTAVAMAFLGFGVLGAGGAGGVIPYRMGASSVRAAATIQNTAGSPVNALTLTALWAGTRGNDISFVLDADPADASNDRLRIRFKGVVVETYTYPEANVTQLGAAINSRSEWITAAVLVSGTALATTSGTSLAAGANGTVNAGEYTAAMDALEFQPFTLIAPANLTDSGIQASFLTWVRSQESSNRPVIWAVGGAADETLDTALTRSTALTDPHVVNLGVGTYHDDLLDKDLSTAQLAPRIAGILAAAGRSTALTGAELGGLHVVGTTGPTTAEAEVAVQRGLTVLMRTDSPDADLRIAKGVTTFVSTTDAARPLEIFSEPRFIRIMDLFIREMRQWGDRKIIGKVPVNADTRDAVRQQGGKLIDELLREGLILTVAQGAEGDPFIRTPVTTNDTLPFEFGWQFAYTTNYLLGDGRVR